MTRASLMNLAVYSEQPGSLQQQHAIDGENHREPRLSRDCHRSRLPRPKKIALDAWISAHCHVSSVGSKQVCSEQISFLLKGGCTTQLPSIVLSNLDSDLPLYLWWQEEFREPMDPQLWTWVDRVIYDSHGWSDFPSQRRLLETAQGGQPAYCALRLELDAAGQPSLRARAILRSSRFASSPRQDQQGADRFCTRVQINRYLVCRLAGSAIELAYRRGEIST